MIEEERDRVFIVWSLAEGISFTDGLNLLNDIGFHGALVTVFERVNKGQ